MYLVKYTLRKQRFSFPGWCKINTDSSVIHIPTVATYPCPEKCEASIERFECFRFRFNFIHVCTKRG